MSLAVGDISSPSSELDLHHHTAGQNPHNQDFFLLLETPVPVDKKTNVISITVLRSRNYLFESELQLLRLRLHFTPLESELYF